MIAWCGRQATCALPDAPPRMVTPCPLGLPPPSCPQHSHVLLQSRAQRRACPIQAIPRLALPPPHCLQGLLQRSPEELAPGEDFSQTLCFSEEAMQAAAGAARRRAAAAAPAKPVKQGAGAARGAGPAGCLPGAPLGMEGVEEWCHRQEVVVLINEGQYVVAPDESPVLAAAARPLTALVAA